MPLDPSVREVYPFALRTSLGPVFKLVLGPWAFPSMKSTSPWESRWDQPELPSRSEFRAHLNVASAPKLTETINFDSPKPPNMSSLSLCLWMQEPVEVQVYSPWHLSLIHGTPWPHQESEPPPDISDQRPCRFAVIQAVYTTAVSARARKSSGMGQLPRRQHSLFSLPKSPRT